VLTSGGHFVANKLTQRWRKNTAELMKALAPKFRRAIKGKEKPLKIGFFFIRDSKRLFDFNNMTQCPQDAMVFHKWIPDDNITEMVPIPLEIDGQWYRVDKENAGVIIRIL